MTEQPAPKRRIQLHLADLIFVAVLVGVLGGFVLSRILDGKFSSDPGLPYPSAAVYRVPVYAHLVGVFAVLLGSLPLIVIGHLKSWKTFGRWFWSALAGGMLGILATSMTAKSRLDRRMAMCENSAMAACKAYCTAQDIYRRFDYNKDGVLEYAQSARGTFGLGDPNIAMINQSWANAFDGEGAPPVPSNGYIFKILKAKGGRAPGGAGSYLDSNGRMTKGYAMIACPAVYGHTGGSTYLVSNSGSIYYMDLGEKTPTYFKNMTEYNPLSGWDFAE